MGVVALAVASGLNAADPKTLRGPVEELGMLDDFTIGSQESWTVSAGSNVGYKLETGLNIPGVASSVAQLELSHKDGADLEPGHNWIALKRALPLGTIGREANGIRLVMGSQPAAQWWINVSIRVGSETYSHVLEPTYPSRALIEHVIPFDEFLCSGQPLTAAKAVQADGLGLDTSVPQATLLLDRITTYRQQTYSSWLEFKSSHPEHDLFQPGEAVMVTFVPGGTLPVAARSFRYEVQDFEETITAAGRVSLDGSASYKLDLTPKSHGYYELRAYWLDQAGKDLENRSCILAEGSMPSGLATFSVLPRTLEQNIERFRRIGTNAFFGLHGDFMGMADLMGLAWRFDYSLWNSLEPHKPDRSSGMAPWATARIKNEAPRPDYRLHILPGGGNFAVPNWAKDKASKSPPNADWEDYFPVVKDSVEVEKHLYPHLHPRRYGVAWEVNLNMPPANMGPAYTPVTIVELHRRVREAIKATDPDSIVMGPCPSNLNPTWMEQVFAAGLLDYVDAIESHGYADSGFAPEENDYPGKLSAIRGAMRRYHHDKELPIYITEAGIRGMLGSKIVHRQQAQFMTRLAIILKGEGIRVFLPFYGIDYDRDGWWGFCFNLEVDAQSPWATKRISPKPTVSAMAACVDALEGTTPVRRVTTLGDGIWAYLFQGKGGSVLAVWSVAGSRNFSLRPDRTKSIEVRDIMGHEVEAPLVGGAIEIMVDGSPKYVTGVTEASLR